MREILSPRNQKAFQASGKLVAGYLVAGYPDADAFLPIAKGCVDAGLDIFEIGFPSQSPILDGKTIQQAHKNADQAATGIGYWEKIRKVVDCPIWIMGYQADLLKNDLHIELAKRQLVDCFVIPDLSFDERRKVMDDVRPYQIDIMGFINPAMSLIDVANQVDHFNPIYTQLYAGPTGVKNAEETYHPLLPIIRAKKNLFAFAGFGIDTPQRAKKLLCEGFDGIIIGTAMVEKLNDSPNTLYAFIQEARSEIQKVEFCP